MVEASALAAGCLQPMTLFIVPWSSTVSLGLEQTTRS